MRRRRSGRGRVLVGSATAHSDNQRVPRRSTRRVPWRGCAGSSASAEGSHHLVSIERIRLRGNGDSGAIFKAMRQRRCPTSPPGIPTVPTVIGAAASARRRRALQGITRASGLRLLQHLRRDEDRRLHQRHPVQRVAGPRIDRPGSPLKASSSVPRGPAWGWTITSCLAILDRWDSTRSWCARPSAPRKNWRLPSMPPRFT